MVAATVAGATATLAIVVVEPLRFAYRNPDLHVALLSVEALIGVLAACLAAGRFNRRRLLSDLLLCCGLTALALSTLWFGAIPAIFASGTSPFATWSALAGRLLGAALFCAAAVAGYRRLRMPRRRALAVAVGVLGALGAIAIAAAVLAPHLPRAIDPLATPERSALPRLEGHPAILAAQLLAAVLYALAAVGYARRGERDHDPFVAWLPVGAVLAAYARVNYVLFPSAFTEYVYTGDAFRLAFYAVVMLAVAGEIRAAWRREAEAAALEERRRVARDLHDGVAQELASVRRNLRQVAGDDEFVARAAAAADRALADARKAITALSDVPDGTLDRVLADTARTVADREGTHVALDLAPHVRVAPAEAEAIRLIVAEAITNAARHGGANVVRVRLEDGRHVRLFVRDDGRGFDAGSEAPQSGGGFGLESMRQRAQRVGARLTLRSRDGAGTELEVVL